MNRSAAGCQVRSPLWLLTKTGTSGSQFAAARSGRMRIEKPKASKCDWSAEWSPRMRTRHGDYRRSGDCLGVCTLETRRPCIAPQVNRQAHSAEEGATTSTHCSTPQPAERRLVAGG